MSEIVVIAIAQLVFFGCCFVPSLGALLHPRARQGDGDTMRTLGWLYLGFYTVAFAAAVVGIGAVSWVMFFLALTTAVVLDVQALRAARKARKIKRQFDEFEAKFGGRP
jgi:Flp pilus assembly protein TadB